MAYERDYGRGSRSPYQRYDERDRWRGSSGRDQNPDDRGFLDRAGDEVRSWFGDDDAERRRERDDRMAERYERERGYGRDDDDRRGGHERSDYGPAGYYGGTDYGRGGDYGRRGGRGRSPYAGVGPGGYGARTTGEAADWGGAAYGERDRGRGGRERSYGEHDYDRWRNRQIDELDRDYDEYRRENHSRFDREFSAWRSRRQDQRRCLDRVKEQMEVIGSDGEHVGTVDCVRGDHVVLTKSDAAAGGYHHSIPSSWIDEVDDKVKIIKSADDAHRQWRDEDRRQALFHEEDDRRSGPHILNRSFSGTY